MKNLMASLLGIMLMLQPTCAAAGGASKERDEDRLKGRGPVVRSPALGVEPSWAVVSPRTSNPGKVLDANGASCIRRGVRVNCRSYRTSVQKRSMPLHPEGGSEPPSISIGITL